MKYTSKKRLMAALLAMTMLFGAADSAAFALQTEDSAAFAVTEAQEETAPSSELPAEEAAAEQRDGQSAELSDGAEQITVTDDEAGESPAQTNSGAAAFASKNLPQMVQDGTLAVTEAEGVSIQNLDAQKGLLVSGSSDALAQTTFAFAEPFAFGSDLVGRLDIDAMAKQRQNLTLSLYLDEETEPAAQIRLVKQKRSGRWFTKVQATSLYEKKLTGTHQVSFRVTADEPTKKVQVLLRSLTLIKSTIPVVYLNIDEAQGTVDAMNSDPNHDTECYGSMTVEVPDGYSCEYADAEGRADNITTQTYPMEYIRGRGNSTWGADKKPYKIKLDKKADLFHMGANKHWVLLADYYDPSHLRNKGTYWLGQQLGMEFTPQCVYVDVIMNGTDYGSYLLCEQVRVGASRVEIDELGGNKKSMQVTEGEELTGGYLLGMSPYEEDEGYTFKTVRDQSFEIESPDFEDYDPAYQAGVDAQIKYISDYMQATENAIYAEDGTYEGKHYSDYMDLASAVDYYWVQEVSINGDAFGSPSTYLYKKRSGKLFWGPLWDFDYVAWGNNEYNLDSSNYQGWSQRESTWFAKLMRRPEFVDLLIKRWPAIRDKLEELSRDGGQLDRYAAEMLDSQEYNKVLHGANYEEEYSDKTFADDVAQLKGWIRMRTAWIDRNVSKLRVKTKTITFLRGSKVVDKRTVVKGDMLDAFPREPTRKGYDFRGWFTAKGERLTVHTPIRRNIKVKAKWIKKSKVKPITKIILGYSHHLEVYDEEDRYETKFSIPYKIRGGSGLHAGLVWRSSNPKVATVDSEGVVTVHGVGRANITLSREDGKVSAKCRLKVISYLEEFPSIEDFTIKQSRITMKAGSKRILNPTIEPRYVMDPDIEWISIHEDVAIAVAFGNKAMLYADQPGDTTLVAIAQGDNGRIIRSVNIHVTR